MNKNNFDKDFIWGVSSSALQSEGAWQQDDKGLSIWDEFSKRKKKIKNNHHPAIACDFYNRYQEDIGIINQLNIPNFRFSLSWSRILPDGTGKVNQKGIDFYKRVIDTCLEKNITPWVTLYHWDLPQALQHKGGWTNRDMIDWFGEYAQVSANHFKDTVKHWMVMNEPMVFT
ncbi:MAG: family 1 glycosylhydrolase, partial [Pseudomonadota bacterium]